MRAVVLIVRGRLRINPAFVFFGRPVMYCNKRNTRYPNPNNYFFTSVNGYRTIYLATGIFLMKNRPLMGTDLYHSFLTNSFINA